MSYRYDDSSYMYAQLSVVYEALEMDNCQGLSSWSYSNIILYLLFPPCCICSIVIVISLWGLEKTSERLSFLNGDSAISTIKFSKYSSLSSSQPWKLWRIATKQSKYLHLRLNSTLTMSSWFLGTNRNWIASSENSWWRSNKPIGIFIKPWTNRWR